MKTFEPRGRLRSFTEDDWRAVGSIVQQSRFSLAHASVQHALPAERLLAFMLCLEADHLGELFHRLYHVCEAHPIRTLPFRKGLPDLPFRCPECEQTIETRDELTIDVECVCAAVAVQGTAR
jgi:hypothetical protein